MPTNPSEGRRDSSVAVIIVNYNGGELLAECLRGLEKQTVPPDRILVMDNASSDDSLARARAILPGTELIELEQNLGFAAANNQAAKLAEDVRWIALLNPDAVPEPRWLEELLAAGRRWPDCAAFGSLLLQNPRIVDGTGDSYHMSGAAWRRDYGSNRETAHMEAGEIFSPCAAAALYDRQLFLASGGLDEDFFCYVEDVDLGFRLRLLGSSIRFVPSSVVYHIGSATTGGDQSEFTLYHGHRNLVWAFVKNMPGALFWLLLPLHLLLNTYVLIAYSRRGKGRTLWRSKRDALLGIGKMWKKRGVIQKQRKASVSAIWRRLEKRRPWPHRAQ